MVLWRADAERGGTFKGMSVSGKGLGGWRDGVGKRRDKEWDY